MRFTLRNSMLGPVLAAALVDNPYETGTVLQACEYLSGQLAGAGAAEEAVGVALLALSLLLTGCSSIGPGSVVRDRYDYASSIADSWKRQALINIVKLRYMDPPVHVDVGQAHRAQEDGSVGRLQREWGFFHDFRL